MKLLLDENLSCLLVPILQAEFLDSTQVALAGFGMVASARQLWLHVLVLLMV